MKGIDQLGAFKRHDDNIDVRFERFYPRPIDRVWSALTQPERLQDWMGASRVWGAAPFLNAKINSWRER